MDDLLEKACLDLEHMEKMATSIRDTISTIINKRSGLVEKNLALERRNLDLSQKVVQLRRNNFELRRQSLHSNGEGKQNSLKGSNQQNSSADTNIGNVSRKKETDIEAQNRARVMKRNKVSNEKCQAKRSKVNCRAKEDGSKTFNKGNIDGEEAMLMFGKVDSETPKNEEAPNCIDDANLEDNDPISIAGFENDSSNDIESTEKNDEIVEGVSFTENITNINVNDGDSKEIVVTESTIVSNEHKNVGTMSYKEKQADTSITSDQDLDTDRTKTKTKHLRAIERKGIPFCKKADLKALTHMGALVNTPIKVLHKGGIGHFSLSAIQTIMTAKIADFNKSLSCAHMPDMEKGKILLVRDVYDPITYKMDPTKCGFKIMQKGETKGILRDSHMYSGWTQKLMRLNPDTFSFIEVTRYCKPKEQHKWRQLSDCKAKIFFKDQSKSEPYTMNSNDIYIHFMQRNRYLPHSDALTVTMQEIVVINLFNAPDKMHVLNSAAYCYAVFASDDKNHCYPPGETMPHPTVHAVDCQLNENEKDEIGANQNTSNI